MPIFYSFIIHPSIKEIIGSIRKPPKKFDFFGIYGVFPSKKNDEVHRNFELISLARGKKQSNFSSDMSSILFPASRFFKNDYIFSGVLSGRSTSKSTCNVKSRIARG